MTATRRPLAAASLLIASMGVPALSGTPTATPSDPVVSYSLPAERPNGAIFTVLGAAKVQPEYFGSDDFTVSPSGAFRLQYLKLGALEIGSTDPNVRPTGFGPHVSFRAIPRRSASESPELTGLDSVDFSIELGGGLAYRTQNFEAFLDARYGVIGHNSWVAELGADYIARPNSRWTFKAGPRLLWGSDKYADTYFGVTPAESAANGTLAAYNPSAGLVSAGLEVGAHYAFNDRWGVDTTVTYARFLGDAEDSPIVQQGTKDWWRLRVGLTRKFNWLR